MGTHLLAETRLSLTELAREQGVSVPTVWRWATRGLHGVRLESFNLGGRRFTTRESFGRWIEKTQTGAASVTNAPRSSRQRDAAINRAAAELAEADI